MVKTITVTLGNSEPVTDEDVALALEKIAEQVMEGYTSGQQSYFSWEMKEEDE